MSNLFPVIEVPDDAAQSQEAMGSRPKFWFRHPEFEDCLFKQTRPNTGEDWSEKIAAELAQIMGIPHATYELATWQEKPGVISRDFRPSSPPTDIIHGNDILARLASNYPREKSYRASQHTVSIVLNALRSPGLQLPLEWTPPPGITEPISVFIAYLLLDAWIGNSDRHHENWGFVIRMPGGQAHLAPSYDHASCLGRELLDSKRQEKLRNQTIQQYAEKSRSAFFKLQGDKHAMLTFDVFAEVARDYSKSAEIWLEKLAKVSLQEVQDQIRKIPPSRISTPAAEFSYKMLEINRNRLLRLRESL